MASSSSYCDACGEPPRGNQRLKKCTRCHKAWYHDGVCQREHYPFHKSACRQAASAAIKAAAAAQQAEIPEAFIDGIQVVDSGGALGKIAIATRDFKPLDVVLLEPPAVVFGQENGYFGLFDSFLNAPSETKTGVLEMMYPPITTTKSQGDGTQTASDPMEEERRQRDVLVEGELRRYQQHNPAAANELIKSDPDLAKKLVRIVGNNAHSFYTTPTGDLIANDSSGLQNDDSALYVIGSKAEHSCAPNLRFCTDKGMLRYTAETFISRGDRLSISYASSVLQSPLKQRREFLLENKAFFCKCIRCLGPDECRPLCCDQCKSGVIFQQGSTDTWCCVSLCGDNVTSLGSQQRAEDGQMKEIARLRDSLQHGVEESTIDTVMAAQARVAEKRHPLHWLHVAAWDLVSIVASSYARALMLQEGIAPGAPKVAGLLRLSATCQLHQILWTERNTAIVYGRLELKDAVAGIETNDIPRLEVDLSEDTEEVCTLLDLLTDPQHQPPNDCTEVLHTMFHAGQDLLLAGHSALASRLYARYENLFLGSPWAFSDNTKDNFRALVQSGGKDNRFANHLLAAI